MAESFQAKELLREAAVIFDTEENGLAKSAHKAWRGGFSSGGEWMREALRLIRFSGQKSQSFLAASPARIGFQQLGMIKYGLALLATLPFLVLAIWTKQPWIIFAAVPVFYMVEVQMAFLFPLAIDGSEQPFRESHQWTKRAGGTGTAMMIIMPIAATMLFGGFCKQGFLRSWSLGCLAVLIWYERLKTAKSFRPVRSRLEINASQPLLVRKERFDFLDNTDPVRVLYASDLHFFGESSRHVADQLVVCAHESTPDVILLGGDLVDTKCGLPLLRETVRRLREIAKVWAIGGNHDRLIGIPKIKAAVENGGGNWLGEDSILLPRLGQRGLWVDGSIPSHLSTARGRLLCAHDPIVFTEAAKQKYSLVLAGHLHGGQCVVAERNGKLFPAAWFYRWNGLRFDENGSTMLVSRGISDTLPVRWNCPREVILCEIF